MASATGRPTETALALAIVDADLEPGDLSFYGLPIDVDAVGDVGVASVAGSEAPAASEEVLLAFHDVLVGLGRRGACLPHRFGTLVDLGRALADLDANADVLSAALEAVRGRSEVLVRARVVPSDVVRVIGSDAAELQRVDDPMAVGRAIHELTGPLVHRHVAEALDAIGPTTTLAFADVHGDGLGADVVMALRADEFDVVAPVFETLLTYCEVERFDPTPCYRSASRLLGRMSNHAA